MNMMKKLLVLTLVLSLLLALTACAGVGTLPTPSTKAPETTAEKQADTEPPATEAPATEPPATEPPATEPPATEPPATEPPATEPEDDEVFAAIGNPALDRSAVGTWRYVLDYGELMNATATQEDLDAMGEMGEALLNVYDGLQMDVILDLRSDGSFSFGFDEDSARAAIEEMISRLGEVMIPLIASMLEMTEEQMLEQLEAADMTVDDLLGQFMGEMDSEEMVEQILESYQEGSWRYVDGKLYLVEAGGTVDPDSFATVELAGGVLTITDVPADNESSEMYEAMLPMEFNRK